ncbi:NAD(P)/FAD-dependent oxidoreductase [Nocardioides pocheonensis]|uniref:Ferredoxin reductase n=1 Tax=Nocardioides pocheonensis TaxID=661485 RepID=A0A3N0GI22_9ACTN|nr:FAD-dependent oxidoreductase [Nocardioides pocheonensis]RNM12099.1 ferredoxin reductase [Nocardioides pocheonensis]
MSSTCSVVIVGGGIGGVSTAAALRNRGFLGDLTIVDAGELPYDRPPLSKDYLAGRKSLDDIALQSPDWYDDQSITLRNNTTVAALRADSGTVELTTGEQLRADRVVLATGGQAVRPRLPGAGIDALHVLRSAEDADNLRKVLLPGARILVVGAGLIGAEVASTALHLGADVTLVDPLAEPLSAAIGRDAAEWLHSVHAANGITTITAGIDGFEKTTDGIRTYLRGEPHHFDAVVLGVGMTPNTQLAEWAGLAVDRGIIVSAGQLTSNPAVLAVGDPTRRTVDGAVRKRAEHWEAAQHDGARAAATILGLSLPAETAPWFWTDRHGLHVEAVGQMSAATTAVTRGAIGEPPFAVFGIRHGNVVSAAAVNDSNAVRAARRLIDRAIAVDCRQLGDPGVDLRKLLRA